jgi:acetyl esterase
MSILSRPRVAAFVAARLQTAMPKQMRKEHGDPRKKLPDFVTEVEGIIIPSTIPARAVIHRPTGADGTLPVHVNFHGGGFIAGQAEMDDPLCRVIANRAGAAVIDVDYAIAPQQPFPAPPRQAFEVVRWVAAHASGNGWDAARLTIGGQSAGGALAAAAARQALREGGPDIRLQVLHYPPLDLTIPASQKKSPLAKPLLRPWMGEVFDSAYVPDPAQRRDPLVSPAASADGEDLTGIAPAVIITAGNDILRDEGMRYARRLERVGALVELIDVPGADHAYDSAADERTREIYLRIAEYIGQHTRA